MPGFALSELRAAAEQTGLFELRHDEEHGRLTFVRNLNEPPLHFFYKSGTVVLQKPSGAHEAACLDVFPDFRLDVLDLSLRKAAPLTTCVVCLEHANPPAKLSCGHDELCLSCAAEMTESRLVRCPQCRAPSFPGEGSSEFRLQGSEEDVLEREIQLTTQIIADHRARLEALCSALEKAQLRRRKAEEQAAKTAEIAAAKELAAKQAAERHHRAALEAQSRRAQEERERSRRIALQRQARQRERRGTKVLFKINSATEANYNFNGRTCAGIAISGRSVVFVSEQGKVTWTSDQFHPLYAVLASSESDDQTVLHCSMGIMGRYFAKVIRQGRTMCVWAGSDRLGALIRGRSPKVVAFGSEWNSFFVVYPDGSFIYDLIPSSMANLAREIQRTDSGVEFASLGPLGEWFILTTEGEAHYGSVSSSCRQHSQPLRNRLTRIYFGADGGYILRHQ